MSRTSRLMRAEAKCTLSGNIRGMFTLEHIYPFYYGETTPTDLGVLQQLKRRNKRRLLRGSSCVYVDKIFLCKNAKILLPAHRQCLRGSMTANDRPRQRASTTRSFGAARAPWRHRRRLKNVLGNEECCRQVCSPRRVVTT